LTKASPHGKVEPILKDGDYIRGRHVRHALPLDRVAEIMRRYGRKDFKLARQTAEEKALRLNEFMLKITLKTKKTRVQRRVVSKNVTIIHNIGDSKG